MARTDGSSIFLPEFEEVPDSIGTSPPCALHNPLVDRTDVWATDLHLERLSSEPHSVSNRKPCRLVSVVRGRNGLFPVSLSHIPAPRS